MRTAILQGMVLGKMHHATFSTCVCFADPVASYKNLPDLMEKLKQTFHDGTAEDAAKQQPSAAVSEAIPEALAPATGRADTNARMPASRDEAPNTDLEELMRDDPLRAGEQLMLPPACMHAPYSTCDLISCIPSTHVTVMGCP
jgi:hypothetical protein